MPIFVYRCGCGHRFERLVPRDAVAPACPQCGSSTNKIPAGPSLGRSTAPSAEPGNTAGPSASVPIPWRGVARGGPEKLKREVEFRQRLDAKAREGLRTPGGPDRPIPEAGGAAPATPPRP
jgi:putative FmdB family regulatory protein